MKRSTMNLIIATAAVLVATTAASAQTMKAEIPFAFQAAGKVLPAGVYQVTARSGEAYFSFLNIQEKESVLVVKGVPHDAQQAWKHGTSGVLQFSCSDGCRLSEIWTNTGAPAYTIRGAKPEPGKSRVAVIRMAVDKVK